MRVVLLLSVHLEGAFWDDLLFVSENCIELYVVSETNVHLSDNFGKLYDVSCEGQLRCVGTNGKMIWRLAFVFLFK